MAWINSPRFPDRIAVGAKFGPRFSTSQAVNLGGSRVVNKNWIMPLHEGDVSVGIKTQPQYDDLLAYFHNVAGMFNSFRFKNFFDFQVTGAQGVLVNLTPTTWQMHKSYIYATMTTLRKISKPCAGAVIAGGGSYSYDDATGIVTKISGADPTGWTGTFDFPVYFATDAMMATGIGYKLYEWPSIPIRECRV